MKRLLVYLASPIVLFAVSVTTANYNNNRDGANLAETALTPTNVAAAFGKLGTFAVDGFVYAQPLIVETTAISGRQRILVVVTMHNSIYAFDADSPGSAALWTVNVGASSTTYTGKSDGFLYQLELGCLATPVIDTATNVIYATCISSTNVWKLYSFNLVDGSTFHAAVTIAGTFGGVTFASDQHIQRTGLILSDGKVYMAFATSGEVNTTFQGWVMAYDKTSLAQAALWCDVSTVNGEAGIWMGLAADSGGNIYVSTGNGVWDGLVNFGDSVVKLSSALAVLDYFTPSDYVSRAADDADIASARVLLGSGIVIICPKRGNCFVLDQSNLGQLEGVGPGPLQTISAITSYGSQVLLSTATFVAGASSGGTQIRRFSFNGSTFATPASATYCLLLDSCLSGYPGHQLSYSANGSSTGVLWSTTPTGTLSAHSIPRAGTLRAFNPTTLAVIYSSDTKATDVLGTYAKFCPPVVANGKVFVATFDNVIAVYGLLPSTGMRGASSMRGVSKGR